MCQVKVIYSSKPVKISNASQVNRFLFMLSISNKNTASVVLTTVFPLLLLKNIKSHYSCSKMQTQDCVTISVRTLILPFGHSNVASVTTYLFKLFHPS